MFVKPIGVVQHTYIVRGQGLDKKKKLTGQERVTRVSSSDPTCHLGQCHNVIVRRASTTVHAAALIAVERVIGSIHFQTKRAKLSKVLALIPI